MKNIGGKALTLMPIGEFEDYNIKDLYALYLSDAGVEIAILDPELLEDMPTMANIAGLEEADEIALFVEPKGDVSDRPVYKIYPAFDRTINKYEVINGFDVSLGHIIEGKYKVKSIPSVIESTSDEIEPTSVKK